MSRFSRLLLIMVMVALVALGLIRRDGVAQARSVVLQSGELLVNPGFEEPFSGQGVANGWKPWAVAPDGVNYPASCVNGAPNCKPYGIPAYGPSQPQDSRVPPRAMSGNSQKWGSSYFVYIAGVYQQVGNVTSGTRLHFSAFVQMFVCTDDQECFGKAGSIGLSSGAGTNRVRIGIDPTGGTDAFSSNIVWSNEINPLDTFSPLAVEAVAQNSTVTVFVYSAPEYPAKHVENFVDNASLTAVGQGGTSTPQATLAPASTSGPAPTLPPGTTTYTIVAGDTLSAIALRSNLTLDQLLALNPTLTSQSVLQVGQVVNVAGTAPTPAASAVPTNTPAPSATPTVAPTAGATITETTIPAPTLVATNSGLCVQAFADLNANTLRDAGEALLPGVTFNIQGTSGQAGTYTTNGQQEPYCFTNLPDGRYNVSAVLPAGQVATTDITWTLSLLSGTNVNIAVGAQQVVTPTPQPTAEPTVTPTVASGEIEASNRTAPLALLGGGALMILAVVALFFGLRSRHRAA